MQAGCAQSFADMAPTSPDDGHFLGLLWFQGDQSAANSVRKPGQATLPTVRFAAVSGRPQSSAAFQAFLEGVQEIRYYAVTQRSLRIFLCLGNLNSRRGHEDSEFVKGVACEFALDTPAQLFFTSIMSDVASKAKPSSSLQRMRSCLSWQLPQDLLDFRICTKCAWLVP